MADPNDGALEQRIIDLITTYARLQPGQVTLDSTFADLLLDSLDGMELIFEFEETFNVTVPDDFVRQMTRVRQVVEALRQMTSAPPVPPATAS